MQAKTASRNRALNWTYKGLLAFLMPLFGLFARTLPLGLMYAIGRVVVFLFDLVRPKYERALRSNLAQILGETPESLRVRRLARLAAHNHVRYWVDFFYWSERGSDGARRAISGVDNVAAIESCMDEGRGCILLTAHLGNW